MNLISKELKILTVLIWIINGLIMIGLCVDLFMTGVFAFFGPIFWVGLILLVLNGTYLFYRVRLNGFRKYGVWAVLGLGFLITLPLLFYTLVILPMNYPAGEPFEDQLTLSETSESAEKNFYRYWDRLVKWKENYETVIDSADEGVEKNIEEYVLNKKTGKVEQNTREARAEILQFIGNHHVAFPKKELGPKGKVPQVIPLIKLFDLELLEIERALQNGQIEKARQNNLLMWKALDKKLQYSSTLIEHLVNLAVISKVVKHSARRPALHAQTSEEFLNHLDSAKQNLGPVGKEAIAYEYYSLAQILKDMKRKRQNLGQLINSSAGRLFVSTGPLYDYWKTRRYIHDSFYQLAVLYPEPFHRVESRLENIESKLNQRLKNWSHPFSLHMLENPVGKIIYSAAFPQIFSSIRDTASVRTKLTMLKWIHENNARYESDNVPTDELSNKTFQIKNYSDTFVIKSPESEKRFDDPPSLTVRKTQ